MAVSFSGLLRRVYPPPPPQAPRPSPLPPGPPPLNRGGNGEEAYVGVPSQYNTSSIILQLRHQLSIHVMGQRVYQEIYILYLSEEVILLYFSTSEAGGTVQYIKFESTFRMR